MQLLVVLALLGPAKSPSSAAAAPAPTRADVSVSAVRLRVEGTDLEALSDALALRLPKVRLVVHDREPLDLAPTQTAVFVDIRPASGAKGSFALTLVVTDGRAYDRTVATAGADSPDDVRRLLATNIANLVAGIEAGTVRADRENVPIPPPPVAKPCPTCPPAEPVVCPPGTTVGDTTPPPIPPPPLEVGFDVAGAAVLGLGQPDDADRFVGAGGGAGVRLRHRSGFVVHLDARVLGRGSDYGHNILRTRVGVGLGYVWRRNAFELETTAAFVVEPWSLRADGSKDALATPAAEATKPGPLLGGVLRIAPGFRIQRSPDLALRVGPRLELASGATLGDGGRVAELDVIDNGRLTAIGRVGGVELSLGAEVVVWFGVGRKR